MPNVRPAPSEYAASFDRYVSLVPESDVLVVLNGQAERVHAALSGLSDERAGHRYAPDKWSVREWLGHVIDAERVFGYRAMSIARGEAQSLPSFDEKTYAEAANHEQTPIDELAEEFATLRRSHVLMLKHLTPDAWGRVGVVGEHPTTTRGMAFIMAGHVRHHANVMKERYGIPVRA
jgi:uncharacterized damage-inducible protein DinB